VIQIALHRRGVSSLTAATPAAGLESAKALPPEVIVLDVDSLSDPETGAADFVLTAKAQHSSLLLVGETPHRRRDQVGGDRIDKPYHFSVLVNKIEQLLARPQILGTAPLEPTGSGRENILVGPASGGQRRAA
jgi:DNA-binding response OmpR family regulator